MVGVARVVVVATASIVFSQTGAAAPDSWVDRVWSSAVWHVKNRPRLARRDCSGLVESILARAGNTVRGNTLTFYQEARRERRLVKKLRPGHLVFFDGTYDANRNGKVDDALTHIAIFTRVERDGTIVMVHRGSRQIRQLRMNLNKPHVHRLGKRILNDFLRAPGYGPRKGSRLSGQLFRSFAKPPSAK